MSKLSLDPPTCLWSSFASAFIDCVRKQDFLWTRSSTSRWTGSWKYDIRISRLGSFPWTCVNFGKQYSRVAVLWTDARDTISYPHVLRDQIELKIIRATYPRYSDRKSVNRARLRDWMDSNRGGSSAEHPAEVSQILSIFSSFIGRILNDICGIESCSSYGVTINMKLVWSFAWTWFLSSWADSSSQWFLFPQKDPFKQILALWSECEGVLAFSVKHTLKQNIYPYRISQRKCTQTSSRVKVA